MFTDFAECDDGAIAEGFSEAVTSILSERWDHMAALEAAIANDHAFEEFVLKHVDGSVPQERLEHVIRLSSEMCPQRSEVLCKRIQLRAIAATAP
jgi:hypothetical protein